MARMAPPSASRRVGLAASLGGAGAAALLGATARVALRRALPQTQGELRVHGLDRQVRIRRDGVGVPHLDAGSAADAAFAMGLLHAQERLWQLETTRRVIAGRLAEFAGPRALRADRFLRRVGLMRVAEREAASTTGEPRAVLDAYAAGVNAGIAATRLLPLEFQLTRVRPEPWRPADSLAAAKLLNLALACDWDTEWQRLQLLRAIGPERAARLDLVYSETNPTILSETATASAGAPEGLLDAYHEVARWLPAHRGGSNSWVVDGSLTLSGRPLLCNDPHLPPGVPSVWYEAHIRVAGDFETYGVTVAGLPFPVIGHNREIAWGYTNSFADVQDLVIEEFETPRALRYRTEAGWAETEVRRETIRVRGRPEHVERVLTTRHGPIVERLDGVHGSGGLALQWTAHAPADTSAAMLALQRAGDFSSFRSAHAHLDGPSQNAVYADRQGHIGFLTIGRIPVRRREVSGLPVLGWSGLAGWERYLRDDEVPQALDPPEHLLVTANNRVVGPGYPHHIAHDYMNGYRALRIRELLGTGGLDAAAMRRIQLDLECPPARQLRTLLDGLGGCQGAVEDARARLVGWDARMTADAEEPLLYEAFCRGLMEHALRPLCGEHWRILAGRDAAHPVLEYPGNILGRLLPDLLARWTAADASLFEGTTTWTEVARRSLEDAVIELAGRPGGARTWGQAHRLSLVHPLAQAVRALGPLLNLGSFPIGGNGDTVMATSHHPAFPYRTALWAPSWRQVLDLSDWDASTGVQLGGQSALISSPHQRDQLGDWRVNRQHQLSWSEMAVEAVTRDTLLLLPDAAPAG
ncbi:MAG: penicillin acylase family protein [Candidatus Dormibacteria bacterium]